MRMETRKIGTRKNPDMLEWGRVGAIYYTINGFKEMVVSQQHYYFKQQCLNLPVDEYFSTVFIISTWPTVGYYQRV